MDIEQTNNTASHDGDDQDTADQRKALVQQLTKDVKADIKHHEKAFKQMREDMRFAREGAEKEWVASGKYVANICQRHIQQRKSALYAKNPRAVAKRRPRMDFQVWDETQASLMAAMQTAAMDPDGLMPQTQSALALLQDYEEGMASRQRIERVGKTLEILFHYALDEQIPTFKVSAKKLIGRVLVCGVGYVELGFLREMDKSPEVRRRMADITNRIGHLERMVEEYGEGEISDNEAEIERLKQALGQLQADPDMVVNEGLQFYFPKATEIIPDAKCESLHGWHGADRVTKRMVFTPAEIKEIYGVDIGKAYLRYKADGNRAMVRTDTKDDLACVFEIYDKLTGQVYSVCDGYNDFLEEPRSPAVKLEQFFPIFPLVFNELESEEELFPHSDVYYLRPMQMEYNRAKHGLREHRKAAQPKYVAPASAFEDEDANAIESVGVHQVAFLQALLPNQKVSDIIQRLPTAQVDPNLYETGPIFDDVMRTVGSQEANLGGTSGATATESSIAEASKMSSQASNVDDLDDFLTAVARASGQIMLAEMTREKVVEIAGRGAVWPQLSAQEIANEIVLEIKAGSSGRPNKAQDLANLERVAPFLIQVPGITPEYMARKMLSILDDGLDLAEAFAEGLPSITAMNQQTQPGTGDAQTDPNQQGAEGQANAKGPARGNEGPQPAYPSGA